MMNKLFRITAIFSLIGLLAGCAGKKVFTGKFGYEPAKPQSGDNIVVYFLADNGKLAKAKEVRMVAYPYSVSVDTVIEVAMMQEGDYWTVKFSSPENERGIVFKFVSGDLVDNNDGAGYVIYLNDSNGKILAGAKAGFASALVGWGNAAGLKRDVKKASVLFTEDFLNNPEIKNDYLSPYFSLIYRKDKVKAKPKIESQLEILLKKKDKSDNDYKMIYQWFNRLNEPDKAKAIVKEGLAKYPKGSFAKMLRMNSFNMERDFDKKMGIINKFEKDFPNDDFVNNMYNSLLYDFTRNTLFDDAYNLMTKHSDNVSPAYFSYVANKMLNDKYDDSKVENLYKLGIKKIRSTLSGNFKKTKPKTFTNEEYKKNLNYYLSRILSGYGNFLYDNNKAAESIPYFAEAIKIVESSSVDPKIIEVYANALLKTGKYDKALKVAGDFIKKGEGSNALTEVLKKSYVKKNGSDKGFDEFYAKISNEAKKQLNAELKNKLENKPAPDFTLYNIMGKKVSLSDLKGKTVIVDFWATWCGPCKSSFPGMKKLVEFYKNNDKVQFLFVNTWENVKDKAENARMFIQQNNYPFNVLIDKDNKVVTDYMVSGIPTKFVIDKKGNIRFESIGFSGNTDQMVEEIKAMVNMIK